MKTQSGFTVLELVISLILVAALYGVLSVKLGTISESAEKASVYATLGQIQKQISLRRAKRYIGSAQQDDSLQTLNPFEWTDPKPENYAGEILSDEVDKAKPGFWYFISDQDQIFYRVKRNNYLKINEEVGTDLRFVLKLNERSADTLSGKAVSVIQLEAKPPFTWVIDDSAE